MLYAYHAFKRLQSLWSGGDTYAASAPTTLNAGKPEEKIITVRQSKYLNNLIEHEHQNIERWILHMPGFKSFWRAQMIRSGIELAHMILKSQFQHSAGAYLLLT